ncbi:uncharacterized protein BDR25DRAFT_359528 [Lindgomyces ingoldianus]|uniref:Uncharacterized protein n=1 Tax=Lindgomyces ingoldianus TaxID=673940 RepID=A0ACB6QI61_9PLEO|nr:uncharacterized protein BDR25DRAFT_359528 [Lindgomyces ingoldianus]KAF2466629.1 hypothetical protein BDR25DRAFT_359528 [Lindgomyces ingoldianus]
MFVYERFSSELCIRKLVLNTISPMISKVKCTTSSDRLQGRAQAISAFSASGKLSEPRTDGDRCVFRILQKPRVFLSTISSMSLLALSENAFGEFPSVGSGFYDLILSRYLERQTIIPRSCTSLLSRYSLQGYRWVGSKANNWAILLTLDQILGQGVEPQSVEDQETGLQTSACASETINIAIEASILYVTVNLLKAQRKVKQYAIINGPEERNSHLNRKPTESSRSPSEEPGLFYALLIDMEARGRLIKLKSETTKAQLGSFLWSMRSIMLSGCRGSINPEMQKSRTHLGEVNDHVYYPSKLINKASGVH